MGAILALLPLALGLGTGAALHRPLALAVIGGLSVSVFFTLLTALVLFVALELAKPPRPAAQETDRDEPEPEELTEQQSPPPRRRAPAR